MKTALIIVDVQNDFLPGGALGITDGDAVVAPLLKAADEADLVVASRDWHPQNHISFKSQGGPWPEHCVAGTKGAYLVPEIEMAADVIVDKGTRQDTDDYSAFRATGLSPDDILYGGLLAGPDVVDAAVEAFRRRGLAGLLKEAGIDHVKVGGLATDYCVKATVLDSLAAGFDTTILVEASRAVNAHEDDMALALRKMRREGAKIRR